MCAGLVFIFLHLLLPLHCVNLPRTYRGVLLYRDNSVRRLLDFGPWKQTNKQTRGQTPLHSSRLYVNIVIYGVSLCWLKMLRTMRYWGHYTFTLLMTLTWLTIA